ncbi:MAG TPA: TIGR01244 family sulfur transferase [Sphingomicrobium sp.]|nr:TIGR01244 family sulfur transferase [Sphingomicrobium sp.]
MICQLDEKTLVSSQIAPADVADLKARGVTMIVNNRPDGEDPGQPTGLEIEQAAEAAGISYRAIPIVRGIGPADVEAMQEAISAADGTMLAYCRAGTRSTLAWAVARRKQGASVEELAEAAARARVDLAAVAHLL